MTWWQTIIAVGALIWCFLLGSTPLERDSNGSPIDEEKYKYIVSAMIWVFTGILLQADGGIISSVAKTSMISVVISCAIGSISGMLVGWHRR
jgi:hypothetical protein